MDDGRHGEPQGVHRGTELSRMSSDVETGISKAQLGPPPERRSELAKIANGRRSDQPGRRSEAKFPLAFLRPPEDECSAACQKVKSAKVQESLWVRIVEADPHVWWGRAIAVASAFCALWIVTTTFTPGPWGKLGKVPLGVLSTCCNNINGDTGNIYGNTIDGRAPQGGDSKYGICPRPTICAQTWYSLVLLGISRCSA
jgi:hypothetical protein